MTEKICISFDWDDLVVDTTPPRIEMAFRNCGKEYVPTVTWGFSDYYEKGLGDVVDEFFRLLNTPDLYRAKLLDDRTPYAFNKIMASRSHRYIITCARATHKFYPTLIQIRKTGILIQPEMLYCTGGDKTEVLEREKAVLHFDDGSHNAAAIIKSGISTKPVLISNARTTWNHSERHLYRPYYPDIITALVSHGVIRL